MRSIDALGRRINGLLATMEQQRKPELYTFVFTLHLFTVQEQTRLQDFLEHLHSRYQCSAITSNVLGTFNSEDFDRFGLWIYLETALKQGDLEQAKKYRRYLSMSTEQLIAWFLALDLSFLPEDVNEPGILIEEGRCRYYLSRGDHRNKVINYIKPGRVTRDLLKSLRLWYDYVEDHHLAGRV